MTAHRDRSAAESGRTVVFRGPRKTDEFLRNTCTAAMPCSPTGENRVPGGVALRGNSASHCGSREPDKGISNNPPYRLRSSPYSSIEV
jgi:hypothetical protein